jgi:hypothetical protein
MHSLVRDLPRLAEPEGFAPTLLINRQTGRARQSLAIELDRLPSL